MLLNVPRQGCPGASQVALYDSAYLGIDRLDGRGPEGEAPGRILSLRALAVLDQDEDPGLPGGAASA
jgi:hypothetical protein